jgi:L-asparaginase II
MDERIVGLLELTRGGIVESTHYGAIAVADNRGRLLYSCGDPQTVAFLRSSAKPFQALPFFEGGGPEHFGLNQQERSLICGSHEGSDEHVRTVESIQAKTGIHESDLQCGVHMPSDADSYRALVARKETPSQNRNNCSGKHSGMLAYCKMRGWPLKNYLAPGHPIQQEILAAFAELCDVRREDVKLGVDGCSAPNFAVPLFNAALAFARLCDPRDFPMGRAKALHDISSAMTSQPAMISGPDEFDCRLMQAGAGQMVCKRGAEGFQAVGVMAGSLGLGSPGMGIAFKVADGDPAVRDLRGEPRNRVRPAVTLEILRQIGALGHGELAQLAKFGPVLPVTNLRDLIVGESRPAFELKKIGTR